MEERPERTERTAKLRPVDPAELETPEDGVPVYRRPKRSRRSSEDSRSMARAAIDQVDKLAGVGLTPEAKSVIADYVGDLFDDQIDRLAQQRSDRSTRASKQSSGHTQEAPSGSSPTATDSLTQRAFLGWFVAACFAVALFLGTLALTWNRIAQVEERQDADDVYAMIVANWLVIDADSDYNRAVNLDSMLRIIASQVGADVSRIEPPTRTHPPTAVKRKDNDYQLYKGEE